MTPAVLLTEVRKISTGLNGTLYYPKPPTPRISLLSPLPANPAPTLVPWPDVMPLLSSIPAGNGTATNVPVRRFYRLKFLPVP